MDSERYTKRAFHGAIDDSASDAWRWYTTDRRHARHFGQVFEVEIGSAFEPAVLESSDIVGTASGYDADAMLYEYLDEIDAAWAIVRGWEGAGECIIIREPHHVDVRIIG